MHSLLRAIHTSSIELGLLFDEELVLIILARSRFGDLRPQWPSLS